jgi:signal transduction histidine kinase/CheY-like chemotaxis protein
MDWTNEFERITIGPRFRVLQRPSDLDSMNSVTPQTDTNNPDIADSLRTDQISQLYATAPIGYIGTVIATLATAAVLRDRVPDHLSLLWIGVTVLVAMARGVLSWRFARCPAEQKSDPRWMRWFQISAFAAGCGWGLGGVLMFVPDSIRHHMMLDLLLLGMITAGIYSYAIHLRTFIIYAIPIVIGSLAGLLTLPDIQWRGYLMFTSLLYAVTAMMFARILSRSLNYAIILKYQNAALAEALGKKSQLAEQANVAKSRFLAAASHDLRQPVHALGLFLASLSRMPLPNPALQTVADMESCVAATNDLFSSILDISRLDAGIIQPEVTTFALAPFVRRVVTEHEIMARGKGLHLRFHLASGLEGAYLSTDAPLLERVLRNLLQNAIRYTEQGGILLALRRRGGELVIDVIDTGPGIPADRLCDIFQEFVQLAPQTHERRQGLGLGLSIVQRLSDLLAYRIDVVSRVGHGTRFRLTMALAAAPSRLPAHDTGATPSLSADGRLIVVLDDDPVIVRALMSLLTAWGAQVHGGHTYDALLAEAATFTRCPDLIISDLHLQGTTVNAADIDGIAAISRLRDEFAENIPAILITGETDSRQLRQAYSSGLLVLHKPLQPALLAGHLVTLFSYQPAARAASTA